MGKAGERLRKWLRRLAWLAATVVVFAAVPVIWTEVRCMRPPQPVANLYQPILAAAHHRNEIDTYLTYPEWSIVHAYEDFAGVVRARSESAFGYLASVRSYWSSLCGIASYAAARGQIAGDVKAMLYIIGVSFSGEMLVKGFYETFVGQLTELLRAQRTPEDEFALAVADDYARFLRQTPWYEYPFAQTLSRFWSEVPWRGGNFVRKIERRIALSIEWGVKIAYAKAIGALAGLAPAPLRIRSVVRGPGGDEPDSRIQLIEQRADSARIVETPRYREFTEILRGLAARGHDIVEIAGNDDVFVTIIAPAGFDPGSATRLIRVPIQAHAGWERHGLAVKVGALAGLLRELEKSNAQLEHVYDY